MSTRVSEDGRRRIAESVPGIPSAFYLNDAIIITINKEKFTIDPLTTGWLAGSGWAWSLSNGNMQIV